MMHVEALEQSFEHLPDGVLIVSAKASVHYLNRRAERYLRSSGHMRIDPASTLRLSDPAAQRTLLAMLDRAVNPQVDQSTTIRAPDAMRIALDNEYYLVAQVFPLSGSIHTRSYAATSPLGWEPKAVVFLVDPQRRPDCPEGLISAVLGTTAAEARLARGLFEGKSLAEIAHEYRLRRATIRNQLQSLFDKTATHRQADLVALLHRTFAMSGDVDSV